jgi:hypothetical protein
VQSGQLDAGDATDPLTVMEAMVRTRMRVEAEQRQLSLFGNTALAVLLDAEDAGE